MDKFRQVEFQKTSEKDSLLNQLKSLEAQIEYVERENRQLEQDVSGSEFYIQQLQAERKIIQEKGGNAKRMVARLETSIQLQSRMVEAIETTASHLPRLDNVLDSDFDKILKNADGQLDRQTKRLVTANQMHGILVDRSRLQDEEFVQKTSAYQDQAKAAEKQLDEAKYCLAEAKKILKEEEVAKADLLAQFQKTNQMIESHNNLLEELNNEGVALDDQIGKLDQDATEMGKEIEQARAEAANLGSKAEVKVTEGATLMTQVESLKVDVHGLEFILESNKHIPGELDVAQADLNHLYESVQEAEDELSTFKDASVLKMVAMEVHDKLRISGQVYDRRLAETQGKEEVVIMGDKEIIQLMETKEMATKDKENLDAGQGNLSQQERGEEAQTATLNAQLKSVKQSVTHNQNTLNVQMTSLDNFRSQFADLAVATKRKEEIEAQLEAVTNKRLALRDSYESTNQSFLTDIKKCRDLKDSKQECVKTLELELSSIQNSIKVAKATMEKSLTEAKKELSDKAGLAVEAALEQVDKEMTANAEKAQKAAKQQKAAAEKEAKKAAAEKAAKEAAAKKAAEEEEAAAATQLAAQEKTEKTAKKATSTSKTTTTSSSTSTVKRVSFAKSVATSPCYPANPINRTLSGGTPLAGRNLAGSGPNSNASTATPRSTKGKRTLTSAINKTVPLPSRSQRNATQKKQTYFGFTSSDEEEDNFSGNNSAKKLAPVPKTKASAAATVPDLAKKPTAPVNTTPSRPAKTLSASTRTPSTTTRTPSTPARSPYRIFGSKNNTPNRASKPDESDS